LSFTPIEPDAPIWDAFVEARGGHILQTAAWGAHKRRFGWSDRLVALARDGQIAAGALLLVRRLPLRLGALAYVPRGPLVDWDDEAAVQALVAALDSAARKQGAVALKLEPDVPDISAMQSRLLALGFRPSAHAIQPPRTIVIDITGSEQDILARMNQGTRRKVRTPERKDVNVREGGPADLASFNAMMQTTGARNTFGVHSPEYFNTAYELFAPHNQVVLLMASHAGRDIAGIMVFAVGRRAWYLYGASSDEERSRMPTYGLQWAAIQWARARGCTEYDLWGIPDTDEADLEAHFESRSDGLWGVYGFKRGFGGQVVRAVGPWDRVYAPLRYRVYALAAAARTGD